MKVFRSESGSVYSLLATFSIAVLLLLSALVLIMRMLILSYDISRSFERNGADLITDVRIHYFTSITETDSTSINADINLPSSAAYRRQLCAALTARLAASLGCGRVDGIPAGAFPAALIKQNPDGTTIYEIDQITVAYDNSTGILTAQLRIPITFSGTHFADFTKPLEYRFVFTYKEVAD